MHKAQEARLLGGERGGMAGKVAVMGLLDRHGKDGVSQVRTVVLTGRRRHHIRPKCGADVEPGSTVYTDSLHVLLRAVATTTPTASSTTPRSTWTGRSTPTGCENFWTLLKRALKGTYVSVEPFHLFRYLDEQSFRFNNRKLT